MIHIHPISHFNNNNQTALSPSLDTTVAAVNIPDRTRHKAGCLTAEEQRNITNLVSDTAAAQRRAVRLDSPSVNPGRAWVLRHLEKYVSWAQLAHSPAPTHGGIDPSWRDGVDADTELGVLERGLGGSVQHQELARSVGVLVLTTLVNPATACLDATYAAQFGSANSPATEAMLTIAPRCLRRSSLALEGGEGQLTITFPSLHTPLLTHGVKSCFSICAICSLT